MHPKDWELGPRHMLVLRDASGAQLYEVPLEECTTSAQVLDWIAQISKKTWVTDRVIASLVRYQLPVGASPLSEKQKTLLTLSMLSSSFTANGANGII